MRLGYYINSILRLRSGNGKGEPEPALIAGLAENAGAEVILAGWTGQGAGLSDRDIRLLREIVQSDLYLVIPAEVKIVDAALKFNCDGIILVASGWDAHRRASPLQLEADSDDVASVVHSCKSAGVTVSILTTPDISGLKTIARIGAHGAVIDCYTYSCARADEEAEAELDKIAAGFLSAHKLGLVPNAAHGLGYRNLGPVVRLPYVEDIYLGSAIAARAVITGIGRAVTDAMTLLHRNAVSG